MKKHVKEILKGEMVNFNGVYKLSDRVDIVIHPKDYKELRGSGLIDEASWKDIVDKHIYAYFRDKDITVHVATAVPQGKMCVLHRD
jgi:hypothetical protein